MRVTVGTILGLLATGQSEEQILETYPYLELEDIRETLSCAGWRLEELEAPRDQKLSEFFGTSPLRCAELDL